MSKNVYVETVSAPTPQSEPISGREAQMAQNNAGGYSFVIDNWGRLERFLILGAEGGTYYVKERDFVMQNVACLSACIQADVERTAETIATISESGRAFKNDVALFALAHMVRLGGAARFAAWAVMPRAVRTGRSWLELHQALDKMGVKSTMSRRKAMARLLTERKAQDLAYQVIKYQSSGNLTQRDLVRYSHASSKMPLVQNVLNYLVKGAQEGQDVLLLPEAIQGWEAIKAAKTAKEVVAAITAYRLTWEFVPGQWQGDKTVWEALLPNMPYMALIRNLARLSSYDLLAAGSSNSKFVRERLTNGDNLRKARVHPMSILLAWRTYAGGGSVGHTKLKWTPNSVVRDALEEGFYLAFDHVQPSGKTLLLGLDVSGSMSSLCGSLPIKCSEASAVMAMVSLRAERDAYIMGFDHGIRDLDISRHDSLDAVLRKIENKTYGGTDCALPMVHALDNGMQVDQFVVLTDNETWAGKIHPAQALQKYRDVTGIAAKSVVVGMTASQFSIADPNDSGMLDVVGLDASTPAVVSKFAAGL